MLLRKHIDSVINNKESDYDDIIKKYNIDARSMKYTEMYTKNGKNNFTNIYNIHNNLTNVEDYINYINNSDDELANHLFLMKDHTRIEKYYHYKKVFKKDKTMANRILDYCNDGVLRFVCRAKFLKKYGESKRKSEFPYFDEVDKALLEGCVLIYVDPGKNAIFTMIDDNGVLLSYTNKQRMYETKRKTYKRKLDLARQRLNIIEEEAKLSEFDSKSCKYDVFKEYVRKKHEVNELLFNKYLDNKFYQYNWYSYINKQRANINLVKLIMKTYCKNGEKCKIIMGDWSAKHQLKNMISTPMVSLKRFINRYIPVLNLDEFNTSKINNYTKTKSKKLRLKVKKKVKNKEKKRCRRADIPIEPIYYNTNIHTVLTYQMSESLCIKNAINREQNKPENDRIIVDNNKYKHLYKNGKFPIGCINRDYNAVLNMREIVQEWLKTSSRPKVFSRQK